MKYEVVNRLSKISNKQTQYVKLDTLPTKSRQYPEGTNIFVRRLNMQETFDFTQVDETNERELLETIARVYEDAIVSDNPDFTLYDLELVDFQLAVAVSTIWSSRKAGWNLSIHCPNVFCRKHISKEITLDDFHFSDTVVPTPVPVNLGGVDFNVRVLTVGQLIEIKRLLEKDTTLRKGILEFAYMLEPITEKDRFQTNLDIYNFIRYIESDDYETLQKIDEEITVTNYPLVVECPHCNKEVKINKQLKDLKAYL